MLGTPQAQGSWGPIIAGKTLGKVLGESESRSMAVGWGRTGGEPRTDEGRRRGSEEGAGECQEAFVVGMRHGAEEIVGGHGDDTGC